MHSSPVRHPMASNGLVNALHAVLKRRIGAKPVCNPTQESLEAFSTPMKQNLLNSLVALNRQEWPVIRIDCERVDNSFRRIARRKRPQSAVQRLNRCREVD